MRRRLFTGWFYPAAWALGGGLLVAGCTTTPSAPLVIPTGDPVADNLAWRDAGRPADRALWSLRAGAAALRRGEQDQARAALDEGLGRMIAVLTGPNPEAARARRTFGREADKPYAGEPYERVMANFYRGLLYWAEGEPDNARALFRNGLFIDAVPGSDRPKGDWVLLDYLDGLLTAELGGDGTEARARAQAHAAFDLPELQPAARVKLVVEYGRAPRKVAGGDHGQLLGYRAGPGGAERAVLEAADRVVELPPWDDLFYQAVSRGERVMDGILANQAAFKEAADTLGDVALWGAVVSADLGRGRDRDRDEAVLALASVGVLAKLAGAATHPEADTRTWDNLPRYLSFAAFDLPPGEHAAVLRFYNEAGEELVGRTQRFTLPVPPTGELLLFRSEVPN